MRGRRCATSSDFGLCRSLPLVLALPLVETHGPDGTVIEVGGASAAVFCYEPFVDVRIAQQSPVVCEHGRVGCARAHGLRHAPTADCERVYRWLLTIPNKKSAPVCTAS